MGIRALPTHQQLSILFVLYQLSQNRYSHEYLSLLKMYALHFLLLAQKKTKQKKKAPLSKAQARTHTRPALR